MLKRWLGKEMLRIRITCHRRLVRSMGQVGFAICAGYHSCCRIFCPISSINNHHIGLSLFWSTAESISQYTLETLTAICGEQNPRLTTSEKTSVEGLHRWSDLTRGSGARYRGDHGFRPGAGTFANYATPFLCGGRFRQLVKEL